jgi:hypothetical protein
MTEKIEEPNPQGKTTNPMDNQQETKEKILRVMTGALSVPSTFQHDTSTFETVVRAELPAQSST